ncbi:MAG: hypothetical protein N2380_02255 [bacterium]|nr:hypothetical protein [bacterium]
MRIVAYKVKCSRFLLVSKDKIAGDCLLKENIGRETIKTCKIDENCKLPERLERLISRYFSS